jgi:hypothetical protein
MREDVGIESRRDHFFEAAALLAVATGVVNAVGAAGSRIGSASRTRRCRTAFQDRELLPKCQNFLRWYQSEFFG